MAFETALEAGHAAEITRRAACAAHWRHWHGQVLWQLEVLVVLVRVVTPVVVARCGDALCGPARQRRDERARGCDKVLDHGLT